MTTCTALHYTLFSERKWNIVNILLYQTFINTLPFNSNPQMIKFV